MSTSSEAEVRLQRNTNFLTACGKYHKGGSKPDPSYAASLHLQGADVDFQDRDGWSALFHAGGEGYLKIVCWLVEECHASIDIRESDGCTPLWTACYNGRRDIVAYLLRRGACLLTTGKPDGEPEQTPALAARRQGHPGIGDLVDAEAALRKADPTRLPREKAGEMDAEEFRESMRATLTSMIKPDEQGSSRGGTGADDAAVAGNAKATNVEEV